MKVSNFFKYISVFLLLYFLGIEGVQGQHNKLISAQTNFYFVCASATNNGKLQPNNPNDKSGFRVRVRWSPPLPNADNKYIFELSDANGSFNNPTVLPTLNTNFWPSKSTLNTAQTFDAYVTFPNNLNGKKYRIRVRSTNPASELIATIDNSSEQYFEGSYMNVIQALRTTPSGNVNLCPGQSLELSVSQIFANTGSTNISDYTYIW
ncbi:MAG: gliding motility-associated C-terminal domain-containing protein, partial [Capnocytophaga granulosa]